jgi:hypothetical protein
MNKAFYAHIKNKTKIKKKKKKQGFISTKNPGMVIHTCNLSYVEVYGLRLALGKCKTLSKK